jgi:hypothetical protein
VFCSAQQFVSSLEAFKATLLVVGQLRGGKCALEPLEWLRSVRPEVKIVTLPTDLTGLLGEQFAPCTDHLLSLV